MLCDSVQSVALIERAHTHTHTHTRAMDRTIHGAEINQYSLANHARANNLDMHSGYGNIYPLS